MGVGGWGLGVGGWGLRAGGWVAVGRWRIPAEATGIGFDVVIFDTRDAFARKRIRMRQCGWAVPPSSVGSRVE